MEQKSVTADRAVHVRAYGTTKEDGVIIEVTTQHSPTEGTRQQRFFVDRAGWADMVAIVGTAFGLP